MTTFLIFSIPLILLLVALLVIIVKTIKNKCVLSFLIAISFSIYVLSIIFIYENLGSPKQVLFFSGELKYISHIVNDDKKTITIFYKDKDNNPKLASVVYLNQKDYEKTKEQLKNKTENKTKGQQLMLRKKIYNNEIEIYDFNLSDKNLK